MKSQYHLIRRSLCALCAFGLVFILVACDKGFLEAKPDKSLLVPKTLQDYQALLDNSLNLMNRTPYLGELAADNFFIAGNAFSTSQETVQNCYTWAERIYAGPSISDWDLPYKQIFYANVVLDGLKDYSKDEEQARNIKGMALFYRAWALYQAAQLFAAPYNENDAAVTPGIPVRTSSDVNLRSVRGTLEGTYKQILSDIHQAIPLLRLEQEVVTRPSKVAAFAFMARVQLTMQNYEKARSYADSTLSLSNELLDYNHLDSAQAYPMPRIYLTSTRNPEVLFLSVLVGNSYLGSSNNTLVDTLLYNSYETHDLRKGLFFHTSGWYRGSYIGMRSYQFSGLAVDEMYLIRAEAQTRLGNNVAARNDLNALLTKRFRSGHFIPINIADSETLLTLILLERRKELIARGIRWADLKRINQDKRFAKVLSRKINGKEYTLLPGDARYTFPIPDGEILASGIEQNKR